MSLRLLHLSFTFSLILFLASHPLKAQHPNQIVDSWLTGEERSHITIYEDGGKYFGDITWIKEPNDPETNKPKTAKNGKPLMNLQILKDFIYDDGEWEDGTIYDPESGKTYYCSIEMDGENKIKIRGSLDPMGWLGRTEIWTRVQK